MQDNQNKKRIQMKYRVQENTKKSHRGQNFLHPFRPVLGPIQSAIECVPGLFSHEVKRPGRGVNQPSQSNAVVKERVELQLYSASGFSWSLLGRILPFPVVIIYCLLLIFICLTVFKAFSWFVSVMLVV